MTCGLDRLLLFFRPQKSKLLAFHGIANRKRGPANAPATERALVSHSAIPANLEGVRFGAHLGDRIGAVCQEEFLGIADLMAALQRAPAGEKALIPKRALPAVLEGVRIWAMLVDRRGAVVQ